MLCCVLQENKDAFEIETLEVELFGPDGRIKDIWMFRCVCGGGMKEGGWPTYWEVAGRGGLSAMEDYACIQDIRMFRWGKRRGGGGGNTSV